MGGYRNASKTSRVCNEGYVYNYMENLRLMRDTIKDMPYYTDNMYTDSFFKKLNKRRSKNKIAKKSRQKNRK